MSRSRRKTPIFGIATADSERDDKRFANRALRRAVKVALVHGREPLLLREVSDVYSFAKDGKHWWPVGGLRK